MPTLTVVPVNTMLADLDEALRLLLRRELSRQGFDGVELSFDAPTREWAATLSQPTVDLFLYDLREAADQRIVEWEPDGLRGELRPPLRVDASYAVTAWTREVVDEHRLLSQALAVLYAYPELPDDLRRGALLGDGHPQPLRARVAQTKKDGGADFWSAVGGQYKVSFDYAVTLSIESGTVFQRGPEVRTQTIRVRTESGTLFETHRVGGTVSDDDGPAAHAWVALEETGAWTVTDVHGRFRFERLPAGSYTALARTRDGAEARAPIVVPGAGADLVATHDGKKRRGR